MARKCTALTSLARSKTHALKLVIFSRLGATGAALLLNVMTFCFFASGYVLHVIQMMFINIATGIKLIFCGANSGSKKPPNLLVLCLTGQQR
jgi:hypothetical protein